MLNHKKKSDLKKFDDEIYVPQSKLRLRGK